MCLSVHGGCLSQDWSPASGCFCWIWLCDSQMKQKAGPPDSGRLKRSALAVAGIAGILLCVLIAWPFLGAITWALTLAILFLPLHLRVERIVRHPNIAALLSTAIVIVVVVVPAVFVVERLITEAASGILSLQARVESGELQALLDSHPTLAPLGDWIDRQFDLPSMMASIATWLSNIGAIFVKGSLLQAVEVFITFYLLFYFLRDRLAAKTMIKAWLPLTPPETEHLFRRVAETVHATVYGTLAVAAVQGTLGGLMFWVLGLPTPLLWGLVMGLLSIVPVLGAFVVWIPAAILLVSGWKLGTRAHSCGLGRDCGWRNRQRPAADVRRQPSAPAYHSRVHFHCRRPCAVWRAGLHPRPPGGDDDHAACGDSGCGTRHQAKHPTENKASPDQRKLSRQGVGGCTCPPRVL